MNGAIIIDLQDIKGSLIRGFVLVVSSSFEEDLISNGVYMFYASCIFSFVIFINQCLFTLTDVFPVSSMFDIKLSCLCQTLTGQETGAVLSYFTITLLLSRYFAVTLLLCSYFAVTLQLLCSYITITLQLLCYFAVTLQLLYSYFAAP